MKIYNNANLKKKHHNGVIAIGNFDGIHLGHQKVINEAKKKAKNNTKQANVASNHLIFVNTSNYQFEMCAIYSQIAF